MFCKQYYQSCPMQPHRNADFLNKLLEEQSKTVMLFKKNHFEVPVLIKDQMLEIEKMVL